MNEMCGRGWFGVFFLGAMSGVGETCLVLFVIANLSRTVD